MSRPVPTAPDPLYQLVCGPSSAGPPAASAAPTPAAAAPVRRVIFTNQLTPQVYTQLRQYEYWGGKAIHEILDEALTAFFADKPEARQTLPDKERARLRGKVLE